MEKDNFFVAQNNDNFFDQDPATQTTRSDDWTYLYRDIGGISDPHYRQPQNSVFVTSDFMLHVYHRLLDKEFKYIEQKEFYPRIKKISDTMIFLISSKCSGLMK